MAAIRPSASMIILAPVLNGARIRGYNYRVIMVRRNDKSSFVNAHVFPGGNLDPSDSTFPSSLLDNSYPSSDPAAAGMNTCNHNEQVTVTGETTEPKQRMLPFKICAIRESFEECGILISSPPPIFSQPQRTTLRSQIHDSPKSFPSLLSTHSLKLATRQCHHFSNWITPRSLPRRYDTHFFITVLEEGNDAEKGTADETEVLGVDEVTPLEALEMCHAGDCIMFPPQYYLLSELATVFDYREFQKQGRPEAGGGGGKQGRRVLPYEPRLDKEAGHLCLPGDAKYNSLSTPSSTPPRHSTNGRTHGTDTRKDPVKEMVPSTADGKDEKDDGGPRNRVFVRLVKGSMVPYGIRRRGIEGLKDLDSLYSAPSKAKA